MIVQIYNHRWGKLKQKAVKNFEEVEAFVKENKAAFSNEKILRFRISHDVDNAVCWHGTA